MEGCYVFHGKTPLLAEDVYIAPGARVIGDVTLEKGVSIWFNTVIRGDVNKIHIKEFTNIQDSCVLHCDHNNSTTIGRGVTVGHQAVLHGCTVNDNCLIGIGATVLEEVEIGEGSIIGARSLILRGTKIPPFSMVVGSPAKVIKMLGSSTLQDRKNMANHYYENALDYKNILGV